MYTTKACVGRAYYARNYGGNGQLRNAELPGRIRNFRDMQSDEAESYCAIREFPPSRQLTKRPKGGALYGPPERNARKRVTLQYLVQK